MKIRDEGRGDHALIRQITEAAFAQSEHSSGSEGAIIDDLRADGVLSISLIAEKNGELLGHIAFSPVAVAGRRCGWYGLGPLCVRPDRQRRGIGSALVREGLSRLSALKAGGCVVLGDPAYYSRFGFTQDAGLRLEGVPPEYFMQLTITGEAPKGNVTYHESFDSA